MSKPISIPDYMLDKYSDLENTEPATPGEKQETMTHISEFCAWAVNVFDEQAKQMGYPGTGKVPPEKLGELYATVAERNLSEQMLRKTPEVAAVSLTMGILSMNFIAHRKKNINSQTEETSEDG